MTHSIRRVRHKKAIRMGTDRRADTQVRPYGNVRLKRLGGRGRPVCLPGWGSGNYFMEWSCMFYVIFCIVPVSHVLWQDNEFS